MATFPIFLCVWQINPLTKIINKSIEYQKQCILTQQKTWLNIVWFCCIQLICELTLKSVRLFFFFFLLKLDPTKTPSLAEVVIIWFIIGSRESFSLEIQFE